MRVHEISNDNGAKLCHIQKSYCQKYYVPMIMELNFATFKNLIVKSTMFPHRNIRKFTWTSPDGKTQNQIGHILIGGGIHLMSDHFQGSRL
jgi:hypothetical protein